MHGNKNLNREWLCVYGIVLFYPSHHRPPPPHTHNIHSSLICFLSDPVVQDSDLNVKTGERASLWEVSLAWGYNSWG